MNPNKLFKKATDNGLLKTLENFKILLDSLDQLIKASKLTVKEIEDICKISESQYHRRKNNADLWTYKELLLLIKKIEQRINVNRE